MKIIFSNREQFELSVPLVLSPSVRLRSDGDIDIGYADMTYTFFDKYHGQTAVKQLEKMKISDFVIDNE